MWRRFYRKAVGISLVFPFFLLAKILWLILGKKKSKEVIGKLLKYYLVFLAEKTVIPQVKDKGQFDEFKTKMKQYVSTASPLYDVHVKHEDENKLVLNYQNCPFCEALFSLKVPELCPYACDSDWVIAEKNAENWGFEREHSIGMGHDHCDHTYCRKT